MTPRSFFLTPVIAMVAVAGASPALAQLATNSREPIHVAGDVGETVNNITTITGNVLISQGPAVLAADRVVAEGVAGQSFSIIRAFGSVRYSNGEDRIAGDEGVYDAAARTLTMTGKVAISQGRNIMTGGRLLYWLDTGKAVFTSPDGGRIRGVFHQSSEPQS